MARADEAAPTREFSAQILKLSIPTNWKEEKPSNNLRLAQFSIPPVEGDSAATELVISGPFGGSRKDNVDRWLASFDAEGRKQKITLGKAPLGEYLFVDLTGTYKMPDGPPIAGRTKPTPGYRMLAVMLGTENGNYFFKLVGPQNTVKGCVDQLRASFGAKADSEKPYETEK